MGSENKNGKVPLISKIAYGFGDVGCNFSWMFVSNFLMIFYTDDVVESSSPKARQKAVTFSAPMISWWPPSPFPMSW